MSTHPNTILMVSFTPDNLSRKTMRNIIDKYNGEQEDDTWSVRILDKDYHGIVMEEDYEENFQISAMAGDLVFLRMVTYGFGERVEWNKLADEERILRAWAVEVCWGFNCSYKIFVTANYW